ncbi:hypothetical protein M501DRAFT_908662, partial [Patellaria atrata CBS 101060]
SQNDYSSTRPSKFRFKSKRPRPDDESEEPHRTTHRRRHTHRSRHPHNTRDGDHKPHHRSKRCRSSYHSSLSDNPALYDNTYSDSSTAFRESLFDALADEEGADYWSHVYGQPIHIYPNTTRAPNGELERMTDEEYTKYVRARMWEKSHQHIREERQREQDRKKRQKEWERKKREMRRDRDDFQARVQASLARGEERRNRKRWREVWERYTKGWEELLARGEKETEGKDARMLIPWPVESGRWKDIDREGIENFFRNQSEENSVTTVLKVERVRWHPDKMQHRFGRQRIDEETLKLVTAVFQVIDRLWSEVRDK